MGLISFPKTEVYLAQKMSGEYCDTMLMKALIAKQKLEAAGFKVFSPVVEEGILPVHKILKGKVDKSMTLKWVMDKAAIRGSDVLLWIDADKYSAGAVRESGLMRYGLWRPVVYVYKKGRLPYSPVPYLEDDVVTADLDKAIQVMKKRWGNYKKRTKWRVKLYKRCRMKALLDEVRGWL